MNFEEKQTGLIFAHRLERLGRKAPTPEIQQKINALVRTLRLLYGTSEQEKAAAVLALIHDGAMTAEDLQWETGFDRPMISRIITILRSQNSVEIRTISSGRQGPPQRLIVPTNGTSG